jgi:predicted DNA binding CopG/RHH family protein
VKTNTPRPRRLAPEPGLTAGQIEAEMSEHEPFSFDDPAAEARAEAAIAQADAELESRKANVNFRWEAAPLDVVRQAAELAGVPYQTWMKQVLYKEAIAAITAARAVDPRARRFKGAT